jgi:hypothetical protein
LCREQEVDRMNRGVPSSLVFALALGLAFAGLSARAQAQTFVGRWVHQGPRGESVLEFYPSEKHLIGPARGRFHHTLILDDGRAITGDGYYVFRSIGPKRGWLVLHFSDGHVTREHEHTLDATSLRIDHHGHSRVYVRQ